MSSAAAPATTASAPPHNPSATTTRDAHDSHLSGLDAVLNVRIGKQRVGQYAPRRVVVSKPGPDASLRYYQKESKRQAPGDLLLLRRTIAFRDIAEIQICKRGNSTGGDDSDTAEEKDDDDDFSADATALRIEIVTIDKSSKTNLGLEFPDLGSFQEWHAALYTRWLQCNTSTRKDIKAQRPVGRVRRSSVSEQLSPAVNARGRRRPHVVSLSDTLFGLMDQYNSLVVQANPQLKGKLRRKSARNVTEVALKLQALHDNFVQCATTAAQELIEQVCRACVGAVCIGWRWV